MSAPLGLLMNRIITSFFFFALFFPVVVGAQFIEQDIYKRTLGQGYTEKATGDPDSFITVISDVRTGGFSHLSSVGFDLLSLNPQGGADDVDFLLEIADAAAGPSNFVDLATVNDLTGPAHLEFEFLAVNLLDYRQQSGGSYWDEGDILLRIKSQDPAVWSFAFSDVSDSEVSYRIGPLDFGGSDPVVQVRGFLGGEFPGTETRIVSQDSPSLGAQTASTSVDFNFDYYYNAQDTPDISVAGLEILDISGGSQYFPHEEDIVSEGQVEVTDTRILTEGNLHMWRPYLRNADGSDYIRGSWYTFDVVSDSAPQSDYIDPDTGEIADGVATSTGFFDFLNVPALLNDKIPFAYFYQLKSVVDDLSASEEDASIKELTLVSPTSSPFAYNFEIISADTIQNSYIPEGFIDTVRLLIMTALWLSFGLMVVFVIKREI